MGDKKLKWCYVSNYIHRNLIEGEDLLRTGLYSWIPVFDGEWRQFQEMDPSEYEKFDVIQVNMSAQDLHIPKMIRDHIGPNSKTKIVCNNDYTVELWSPSFEIPDAWKIYYEPADMIFGTEPYQSGALEVLLKRKVHTITHPCFTKRLRSMRRPHKPGVVSVVAHRYDMNIIPPGIAMANLPNAKSRLIGYEVGADRKKFVTSCLFNGQIFPMTNYQDFCEQLMDSEVVVDPFTLTSQSRTGWDCAALGVPLVGSDRCYSTRVCYPFTACDPYDVKKMRELTLKVLNDAEFRKKVIDYASEAVEVVSYDTAKQKYLDALEEGSPRIEV